MSNSLPSTSLHLPYFRPSSSFSSSTLSSSPPSSSMSTCSVLALMPLSPFKDVHPAVANFTINLTRFQHLVILYSRACKNADQRGADSTQQRPLSIDGSCLPNMSDLRLLSIPLSQSKQVIQAILRSSTSTILKVCNIDQECSSVTHRHVELILHRHWD